MELGDQRSHAPIACTIHSRLLYIYTVQTDNESHHLEHLVLLCYSLFRHSTAHAEQPRSLCLRERLRYDGVY